MPVFYLFQPGTWHLCGGLTTHRALPLVGPCTRNPWTPCCCLAACHSAAEAPRCAHAVPRGALSGCPACAQDRLLHRAGGHGGVRREAARAGRGAAALLRRGRRALQERDGHAGARRAPHTMSPCFRRCGGMRASSCLPRLGSLGMCSGGLQSRRPFSSSQAHMVLDTKNRPHSAFPEPFSLVPVVAVCACQARVGVTCPLYRCAACHTSPCQGAPAGVSLLTGRHAACRRPWRARVRQAMRGSWTRR